MKYPLRASRTGQPTLSRIIISALLLTVANGLTTAQSEQQPKTAKEHVKRGLALQRKGDLDRAIQDYTQAIKLDPNEGDAYNNRGLALLDKRKFDAAIEDLTKLISLRPQEAKSYFNRGLAYLEQGNFDAAVQDFTQAIALNPRLDRPYLGRAQAYRKLGKNDLADADEMKGQDVGWQIAEEVRCKGPKTTGETVSSEKVMSQPVPLESPDHQQTAAAMIAGLQYAGLRLGKKLQAYSRTVEKSAGKLPANATQGQMAEYVLTADEFYYALVGISDNGGLDSDQWFRLWVNELKRLDVTPKGDPMQLAIAVRATPKLIDLDRRKFACVNNELVAVRNLKRLRLISPELLRKWRTALSGQATDVNELVLVHLIIAQDALFEEPNLEDRSQRTLDRLQSLPTESVKTWAEATGYPRLDATFSLLSVQSLFSGETFVKERFDAALPLTQLGLSPTSKIVAQENKSTKTETTSSLSPQDEARQKKDIAQSQNQATPKDASSNRDSVTPQADLSGVWIYERSTPKGAVKGMLELSRATSLDNDGYIAFLGIGTYKNKKDAPAKEMPWLVAIKGKKVLVCIEGPCSVFGCAGSLANDGEIGASCKLLTTHYAGELKAKRLGKDEAQKLKQK